MLLKKTDLKLLQTRHCTHFLFRDRLRAPSCTGRHFPRLCFTRWGERGWTREGVGGSVRRNEIAGRRGHRRAGQRARPRPRPTWARAPPPPRAPAAGPGSPRERGRPGSRAGPQPPPPPPPCAPPQARRWPGPGGARRGGGRCSPIGRAPRRLCARAWLSLSSHVFVRLPRRSPPCPEGVEAARSRCALRGSSFQPRCSPRSQAPVGTASPASSPYPVSPPGLASPHPSYPNPRRCRPSPVLPSQVPVSPPRCPGAQPWVSPAASPPLGPPLAPSPPCVFTPTVWHTGPQHISFQVGVQSGDRALGHGSRTPALGPPRVVQRSVPIGSLGPLEWGQ